jgi:hypothetical protein
MLQTARIRLGRSLAPRRRRSYTSRLESRNGHCVSKSCDLNARGTWRASWSENWTVMNHIRVSLMEPAPRIVALGLRVLGRGMLCRAGPFPGRKFKRNWLFKDSRQ